MATKMALLHYFYFIVISYVISLHSTSANGDNELDFNLNDVCLSEFHIEKYTMASSDSYRDNEMALLIFPEGEPEYAPHFKQDYCARQSKCSLPYSCFKIHAPQTTQHEQGYLFVKSLENEFSKKFYAVIHGYSNTEIKKQFDAFFDYNLGLWVNYLHKYFKQLNDNSDVLTNYIGLKWYYPSPIHKIFYSLIIHSPASQKVFELISFNEPDLSLYPNLRKQFEFKETNELRASFLPYINKETLPWIRDDGGDIVPIKISFGCSNIAPHIEFYTNIMEAKLLYQQNNIISTLDGHRVSYVFLQLVNDMIEIEYVQRPIDYTYGDFTTELYKNLLVKTHNDRITSPTCGLDRWFDNHYGYNTLEYVNDAYNYNYMDRVLSRLLERKLVWRLYHTPYEDESPEGKYWMKQYGFTNLYTLYVFDMNGQTIQMFGVFRDYNIAFNVPIYHKQWCYVACPGNQEMGEFDESKIYVEDKNDIVYKIIVEQNKKYNRNEVDVLLIEHVGNEDLLNDADDDILEDEENDVEENIVGSPHGEGNIYIVTIVCITIVIIGCLLITFCIYQCVMKHRTTGAVLYDGEIQYLLHNKQCAH